MRYILRMTLPSNRTTRSDALVELFNPTAMELRDKLSELLRLGEVSCLVTTDDGCARFYAHDLVVSLVAYLKGV